MIRLAIAALAVLVPHVTASAQPAAIARRIGLDRGVWVVLARQPGRLPLELAAGSQRIVYVQTPDRGAVEKLRIEADRAGLLGRQVYVEQGDWERIHLADNLADVVIVAPDAVESARALRRELLRVVNPLGKILLGDEELRKPFPAGSDDWAHPYHGPDNNTQSADQLARAPYLTQFLAEPWYVPMPEVTVAAAGRVFKAFGHVAYKGREWPWLNTLVALNGYNGTQLWRRALEPGFMIHRNTMIATPETLYLGDSESCKLLDAATGKLKGEIRAPADSTGPVWKWMAMEGGTLYALLGPSETPDVAARGRRTESGWPWRPMTRMYDSRDYAWGFGRTLAAFDAASGRVLWLRNEGDPIDGRAICMKGGRIYAYAHRKWLASFDAAGGKPLWRTADEKLLEAIGEHDPAQTPVKGFSSSAYMKCSEEAVYFAGPQRTRLVAAAARDGRLLWQHPHGNYQLVIRPEGLYAMGRLDSSKLFEPLTGRVLAEFDCFRGNCTRATGTADAILCRGHSHGGTLRLTVPEHQSQRIALMRPDCHDGVIVAGGMSYWGPWMCDCNLSLVGLIGLAPAGDYRFGQPTVQEERLQAEPQPGSLVSDFQPLPGDWPTYRADNARSGSSPVEIRRQPRLAWRVDPPAAMELAAPITAAGQVFLSGSDGAIRSIDAASGQAVWTAYTGGRIYYPPAIEDGRLLAGSADGWVYGFDAQTGRRLWRFRAAPEERKILVHGRLVSTWPVAGGVLVRDGFVYAAAGIASYDGTHVYALDARRGLLRWHNGEAGNLLGDGAGSGVSVQGHLLYWDNRLYLAGGNVVSPAAFDPQEGRCLNRLDTIWRKSPRGRDLFVVDGQVTAFDRLLYAPTDYWLGRYFPGPLMQAQAGDCVVQAAVGRVGRVVPGTAGQKRPPTVWQSERFAMPMGIALAKNTVLVTGQLGGEADAPRYALAALDANNGRVLWEVPLPGVPADWGLALDHAGRIIATLRDGRALCFAGAGDPLPTRR